MGSVRQRGDDKWELRVDLGRDGKGKRIIRTKTVKAKNKTAANKLLLEYEYEVMTGSYQAPEKIKFADFVTEWKEKYARKILQESTRELYDSVIKNYLIPEFGSMVVKDINAMRVIHFLDNVKAFKKDGELSSSTKRDIYRVLRNVMQRAEDWEVIKNNPVKKIKMPKVETMKVDNVYSIAEVKELTEKLQHEYLHWKCFIYLALYGGLRRSEALALELDSIDTEKGTITVSKAIVRGEKGKGKVKEPKTKKSGRTLSVPQFVVESLFLLSKEVKINKIKMGPSYNQKENWLICNEYGHAYYPTSPNKWWKKFCLRNDMRYIAIHDLRHTHVSICLYSGIDPNTTSKRAGHSSIKTTIDIYGHQIIEADQDAAAKLNEQFNPRKQVN
ncbi:tyrosine-type recombinase/integrase [Jeotgalibacillus soli]|uniref:Integrase n=1 Tax=Jeotgalibacillus soli TaxID=889306 RepID=A0A0C2R639_9BACL|nr:site-specific integrase [Jeotgalibacillus soli]KIL45725.1 hypothetical protein KP78_20740 [Jeotgalibacillus soli]